MTANNTILRILPPPAQIEGGDQPGTNKLSHDAGTFGHYSMVQIRISTTNRKRFNEAKLNELAASIKAKGVAQPILIRPVTPTAEAPQIYEIVAGERRFRASIIVGASTIPAMCRNLSDLEALELQILENLQRDDPHPLEEAEGYERLMLTHGYNADQLADKLSKSRSYIYGRLKLCALASSVREPFLDDKFNAAIALLIARLPTPAIQAQAAAEIMAPTYSGDVMSFRSARDMLRRRYTLELKHAVFSIKDGNLIEDAGSCTNCPKRTGNQPEIYSDESNGNICTDPDCYAEKVAAHTNKTKALAEARGQDVIVGDAAKKIMPSNYGDLKGGYVDLNKDFYGAGSMTTYSKLLGKNTPSATMLENPHKPGTWLKIAKLHDVETAMSQAGIAVPETDQVRNAASRSREKEQEAKAKLERAYRTKLFTDVHHASVTMDLDERDLRLVALRLYNQLPGGTIPTKLVMSLHGWDDTTFSYPAHEKQIAAIAALTPVQLNQFIRDCILSHELHVNVYTSYKESDKPLDLLAMAKRTDIDAKAIKKELQDAAKAKADAKKKASDKKAQKSAPKVTPPTAAPMPAGKKVATQPVKKPASKAASKPVTPSAPAPTAGPAAAAAKASADTAAARNTAPGTEAWPFPTSIR